SDLGPLLDELTLAVNMGSRGALRKFKRGRFKSTNFFLKFDILKAEKAATAGTSFDGSALGNILGNTTDDPRSANIANTIGSSIKVSDSAGVWIIGMRYKLLHASTTEQVATGYVEEKIEVGAKSVSILGVTQSQTGGTTMDTAIQRLVEKLVQEIDEKGKDTRPKKRRATGDPAIKRYQSLLNKLGYNTGRPDGIPGKKTTIATTNFQQDYQLPVTGRLDARTKSKLDQLSK
ncbi:MAG: peptidoglycan-binding protein, partial [Methylococcales bacterium]|nr:peptidoglycan-binding protein [Methylococcales bacterium]